MFRFKLIRNIKSCLWLVVFAVIPLSLITIVWANSTGLPEAWRNALETEISKHGFHVKFDSLSYLPLRGFVATGVRVYAEKERIHEISRLERIGLVLDYAKIATGQFRIRKVELRNANFSLPVDPANPSGEAISLNHINGTIFMPSETLMEIRDIRAKIGGIDITISARLIGEKTTSSPSEEDQYEESQRRRHIANLIYELDNWNFDPASPPRINIEIDGNPGDSESIKADFWIDASSIERRGYKIENLTANGNLTDHLLTISSISANDQRGELSGSIDYQISSREGNCDVESSIDIPRLLKSWVNTPLNLDILSVGTQSLQFAGNYDLSDVSNPIINLTGNANFESIMIRGVPFDSFQSSFSYQNGNVFLDNIKLTRPDGTATGKCLLEGDTVRLKLDSTIPVALYKPFFKGQPLELIIEDFKAGKNATCNLSVEGTSNLHDIYAWSYVGKAALTNTSFRKVPLKSVSSSFAVNHHELDFYDASVDFDYSNYSLKKRYDGPSSAIAKVSRVRFISESKTVSIEDVKGTFWPAPLIRMFAPSVADDIEPFRFHRPPTLSGNGVVDVTPQGRTELTVRFKTDDNTTYKFLNEDVILSKPSATVKIKGPQVNVTGLTASVFKGNIDSNLTFKEPNTLSGEISWSKLSLTEISKTYGFGMEGGGQLTGRIDFSIKNSDVRTMSGNGLIALEKAVLFSVPIFGPLSTVAGAVVNDKRFGSERAKAAFCNFNIEKGILSTRDFHTETTSVKFTGDGSVNLSDRTLDFTIRLNARGLLGLITLPFKPFYGLFQFRGTGPLKEPTWENVHFTSPQKNKTASSSQSLQKPKSSQNRKKSK